MNNHYHTMSLRLLSLLLLLVCCCRGQIHQSSEDQYVFPKLGAYKFVAHVSSKAGLCTGAIINEEWVLTAAHCLFFKKKVIGHRDARILAGVTNYEQPTAHSKHETMSEEIHVHPSFHYKDLSKYDVALVRVRDRFTFGDMVGNIAVSGEGWPLGQNGTADCYALGFGGFYSTAPPSADLKMWSVAMAGHDEENCPCARRFQYKRLVCVKESVARMCKGDDGGPLVCGGTVRAVGHMIQDRAACKDPIYPLAKCFRGPEKVLSTFMFLCPVNSWMHSIVPEIPETPASCRAPHSSPSGLTSLIKCLCLPLLWVVMTNMR